MPYRSNIFGRIDELPKGGLSGRLLSVQNVGELFLSFTIIRRTTLMLGVL